MRHYYRDPYYNGLENQFGIGAYSAINTAKNMLGLNGLTERVVSRTVSRVIRKQAKNLTDKFGVQFQFTSRDSAGVIRWLSQVDPKFKSHITNPQVLNDGITKQALSMVNIKNIDFFIQLDEATFAYVYTYDKYYKYDSPIVINNMNDRNPGNMEDMAGIDDMIIYVFGRHMRKYVNILSKYTEVKIADLCQYIVMGSNNGREEFSITAKEINPRPLDSLFFEDNVKERITNHIDKWLENEQLYADRSLLFKTGILLSGEPGTGKSSLATALSSAYNMEIVNINMPSFQNIDIERVIDSINADKNKYIVLLEEIDCVFDDANRKDDASKEDKKFISDLLQFIDSGKSPNNVIFIATTNYPDKLDDALTRKGRFDLIVEVGPLKSREKVAEMCRSFGLDDNQIDDILDEAKLPIAQSTLQYEILQRIKNDTIDNVLLAGQETEAKPKHKYFNLTKVDMEPSESEVFHNAIDNVITTIRIAKETSDYVVDNRVDFISHDKNDIKVPVGYNHYADNEIIILIPEDCDIVKINPKKVEEMFDLITLEVIVAGEGIQMDIIENGEVVSRTNAYSFSS